MDQNKQKESKKDVITHRPDQSEEENQLVEVTEVISSLP